MERSIAFLLRSSWLFKASSAFFVAVLVSFIMLPISLGFVGALKGFSFSDLNYNFLLSIAYALRFSFLQASLSLLCVVIAAFSGLVFYFSLKTKKQRVLFSGLSRVLGDFLFLTPGVFASVLYLSSFSSSTFMPNSGYLAVVFVNVFLNFLFITSRFIEASAQSLKDGGQESFYSSMLFGASRFWSLVRALSPALLSVLKVWAPVVFIWSFSSFSTVLILSGAPKNSSLDILIFYALGSGASFSRVLTIGACQLLLGVVFFNLRFKNRKTPYSHVKGLNFSGLKIFVGQNLIVFFYPVLFVFLLWPILSSLRSVTFLDLKLLESLSAPLFSSLFLAFLAGVFSFLISFLILSSFNYLKKSISFILFVSPMLLLSFYFSSGFMAFINEATFFLKIVFSGFFISLFLSPLMAVWLQELVVQIDKAQLISASLMGESSIAVYFKFVVVKALPVFFKASLWAAVVSFGDVAVTSLLFNDFELFSLVAKRAALSYNFTLQAQVICLSFYLIILFELMRYFRSKFVKI